MECSQPYILSRLLLFRSSKEERRNGKLRVRKERERDKARMEEEEEKDRERERVNIEANTRDPVNMDFAVVQKGMTQQSGATFCPS